MDSKQPSFATVQATAGRQDHSRDPIISLRCLSQIGKSLDILSPHSGPLPSARGRALQPSACQFGHPSMAGSPLNLQKVGEHENVDPYFDSLICKSGSIATLDRLWLSDRMVSLSDWIVSSSNCGFSLPARNHNVRG
jgi:hypothetical protein